MEKPKSSYIATPIPLSRTSSKFVDYSAYQQNLISLLLKDCFSLHSVYWATFVELLNKIQSRHPEDFYICPHPHYISGLLPARRRPQGLVVIGVCLSVCVCVCLSVCVCALFLSARYLKNGFMNHHQIRWVGAGGEPLEEV